MTIRVAMIADHPGPGAPIDGGVQAVTSYLVDAISRFSDIELHVLRFRAGLSQVSEIKGPGYVLHTLPISRLGTLNGYRSDQSVLDQCLRSIRPDVVHSQGGGHLGILAMRAGYPVVVTIHGILAREAQFERGLRRQLRIRFQAWLEEHHCIQRGQHTILISPYVGELLGSKLAGQRYLIPNPVDSAFFELARREVPGTVLFAGRLNARKGVKDLVQALPRLRDIPETKLVLAGSTSDSQYVGDLKAEIGRLGLTSVVEFRGTLSPPEFMQALSECACLVLPSYQETAPMVIQEAMACGVPVVATNICGIPYQVDHGKTGYLFPPGNIEALADKLRLLLTQPALRQEFGAAAKQKAETEYRATSVAARTRDVYLNMLR